MVEGPPDRTRRIVVGGKLCDVARIPQPLSHPTLRDEITALQKAGWSIVENDLQGHNPTIVLEKPIRISFSWDGVWTTNREKSYEAALEAGLR